MERPRPFLSRRSVLGVALAAAWPGAAPGAEAAPPIGTERMVEGLMYIRVAPPPAIVTQSTRARTVASVTREVMEKSTDPDIRRFRDYVDRTVAREPSTARRLELVNVYVNRAVKAQPDSQLYMLSDLWAPPVNTLLIGGDCEDIAILKGWALRRLGMPANDMFLVCGVTRLTTPPQFHALLALRQDPRGVAILDNLSAKVTHSKAEARFDPTYAINEEAFWEVRAPPAVDRPYWDPISRQLHP